MDYEQRALPSGTGESVVRVSEGAIRKLVYERYVAVNHGFAGIADNGRGDNDALQLCGDDACFVVERHQARVCGHRPIDGQH